MDVTFLESEYFYSSTASTSPLQGETWDEEKKWWNTEAAENMATVPTPAENIATIPNMVVEDVAETKSINNNKTVDEEDQQTAPDRMSKIPSLEVPDNETPLHEDIPEVISSTPSTSNILDSFASYHLPFRQNRGKPPARYSPDIAGKKSKYLVSNYVSTQRLPMLLQAFAYKLSSCHIPYGIHEALANPKWSQAIQEEMAALEKNRTWDIFTLPQGKKTVGCK